MKIRSDKAILGLKFETDETEFCLDVQWGTERGGWVYKDIENEQVICGFCAEIEKHEKNIMKLGFMMATEESQAHEEKVYNQLEEEMIEFGGTSYELKERFPQT